VTDMHRALPEEVSAADLAGLLGITKRSINSLSERGVLPRLANGQFNLAEGLQAYVLHREGVIEAEHGTGDFGRARAALYEERASMAKMTRERMEGGLVSVDEVYRTWTEIVVMVRARILALPSKLAPRLLGKTHASEVESILRVHCYEALEDLANVEVVPPRSGKSANGDDPHAEA
jgi:phage terminase Nu1 subunit (DNA packaging protein)